MIDYFEILNQPRRPWLDSQSLKVAFNQMAARRHPDVESTGDGALFIELNSAYATLRQPALRLRHLLELVQPGANAGSRVIPSGLSDVFMELAARRGGLESFLEKQSKASSPLVRALLSEERVAIRGQWKAMKSRVENAWAEAEVRLRELDAGWLAAGAAAYDPLRQLQQELAYLARWTAQIHEALVSIEL